MIKNPPCNAGDEDSAPGQGTKILHAAEQLSPRATTTEMVRSAAHAPQQEKPPEWGAPVPLESNSCSPQLEKAWVQQWRPSTAKNKE